MFDGLELVIESDDSGEFEASVAVEGLRSVRGCSGSQSRVSRDERLVVGGVEDVVRGSGSQVVIVAGASVADGGVEARGESLDVRLPFGPELFVGVASVVLADGFGAFASLIGFYICLKFLPVDACLH